MKSLQKYFCTIFLFLTIIIIAGCNPNVGTSGNGSATITAGFAVTDAEGNACSLTDDGTAHSATVKTDKATLTVTVRPFNAEVLIDGENTKQKELTFSTHGESKTVTVVISYNDAKQTHSLTLRYYKGALNKITVTDNNGNEARVSYSGNAGYVASVGTKKAKVQVETFDTADTVKIDGAETKTVDVDFGDKETEKTLTVQVVHNGVEEQEKITIHYLDPALTPKDPVLTGITVKNADDESQVFALSPRFQKYNSSYTIAVPATVNRIKVEASADTGINPTIVGGEIHALQEGNNVIKVTTVQADNSTNTYEYTLTVKKAPANASSDATLGSLTLESKFGGIPQTFIDAAAAFNPATDTYTCTMNAYCNEFYITATPGEANAAMTVSANGGASLLLESGKSTKFTPLKAGENTFVITVTAANVLTTKTYTVKAKRPAGSFVLATFSGTGLNDFYKEWLDEYKEKEKIGSKNFDATVSKDLPSTTITAAPEFPGTTKMKIKINQDAAKDFNGSETIDLTKTWTTNPSDSLSNSVRVQIILVSDVLVNDNSSPNTYTLWISKVDTAAENKNSLTNLEVQYYGNGYKFYEIKLNETFVSTKTDYTVTLPFGVTEIRVTATPESQKAYIDGWQGSLTNAFFAPFDKEIKIPVIAQNGDRKEYTIKPTSLPATTIKIENIVEGQTIDLSNLPSEGLTVTGSFTNPSGYVSDIWVGSSGLPIQMEKGGKWVQAELTGSTTFKAVLPLDALKELPNGLRDIKAGAFNIQGLAVGVTRVPVTITGNTVPTATVKVTIKSEFTIPANATMSIVAVDDEWWAKQEDVVFVSNELPVSGISFPTDIPLCGIPVGRKCRIDVYIHEKIFGKDTLLYYGTVTDFETAASGNNCTINLKAAQ